MDLDLVFCYCCRGCCCCFLLCAHSSRTPKLQWRTDSQWPGADLAPYPCGTPGVDWAHEHEAVAAPEGTPEGSRGHSPLGPFEVVVFLLLEPLRVDVDV